MALDPTRQREIALDHNVSCLLHIGAMDATQGGSDELQTAGWGDQGQVDWYLDRISKLPPRVAGEDVLRSVLPTAPRSLLDLGCGDGRLSALALGARSTITRVVAVDMSPPMLRHARNRFGDDQRVTVRRWDMNRSIAPLGNFDLILSGFAVHHLEDDRKQSLFAEVATQLNPSGLFANLEVVESATPELHSEFLRLIGRTADDPADRLADVESRLQWMREAGMARVECLWRWRGFALLVGRHDHPPTDCPTDYPMS